MVRLVFVYVSVPADIVDNKVVGLALVPPYTLYDATSLSLLAVQLRVMLVFPAAAARLLGVAGGPSYVQLNWVAAVLLLPAASVKLFAATSMVVAPLADGVKVAVYTVLDVAEKLLKEPPDTVMSPTAKLLVASLIVKVSGNVASLLVEPLARIVEIFLIRGGL